MKTVKICRQALGKRITAQVLVLDTGVHVSVFGGQKPHIGAISIVDPDGNCTTQQFAGHRDGAVSEPWAQEFARAGYRPVVVEAGIHYDHLHPAQISLVLECCEQMMREVLAYLAAQQGDAEEISL